MTYDESLLYIKKNNLSQSKQFSSGNKQILIAPKTLNTFERIKVLKLMQPIGNENTLRELNMYFGNLEVYVLSESNGEYTEITLHDFLRLSEFNN